MIPFLKTIPLFSGLSDQELETVSAIAAQLTMGKDEMIFQEGDRADGFYIVQTGNIKVFKLSLEGKEQILHIYGPGHIFGEVPVFEGKTFPASAMALEDSRIVFLPRTRFVQLIARAPALAMNMLADLSRRLREFTVQIESLSLKEVPSRLAAYILTLSSEQGNENQVTLPISKVQLANLIGTSPETISRALKKLSGLGLIQVESKDILIRNPDGLAEV